MTDGGDPSGAVPRPLPAVADWVVAVASGATAAERSPVELNGAGVVVAHDPAGVPNTTPAPAAGDDEVGLAPAAEVDGWDGAFGGRGGPPTRAARALAAAGGGHTVETPDGRLRAPATDDQRGPAAGFRDLCVRWGLRERPVTVAVDGVLWGHLWVGSGVAVRTDADPVTGVAAPVGRHRPGGAGGGGESGGGGGSGGGGESHPAGGDHPAAVGVEAGVLGHVQVVGRHGTAKRTADALRRQCDRIAPLRR